MSKQKKQTTFTVQGVKIRIREESREDYISLTDIAENFATPQILIAQWICAPNILEFLGVWEALHNDKFNRTNFDALINIKDASGRRKISLEKWIEGVNAVGLISKPDRIMGHKDIAFEFCSWLNPAFKLYVIKEFQRLKEAEANKQNLDWNVRRIMVKANYKIHTEAVREHLIPPRIQFTKKEGWYFATEADILNLALFGMTAKQWKLANPEKNGNMRDHASQEQLLVMSNLQSLNAKLMKWECDQDQRLQILNESAIEEMNILISGNGLKKLPGGDEQQLLK